MVRLIAIDLDDTLLGSDLTISAANRKAVLQAAAQGIHVVIATARNWYTTYPYYRELRLNGFTVCSTGTRILNAQWECVKAWSIPLEAAKQILRYAEQEQIMVMCHVGQQVQFNFVRDDWRPRLRPIDVEVDNLADRLNEPPTQLFVKGEREVALLEKFLPRETSDFRVHKMLYRDRVPEMMIIHRDASKATALAWVCEQLGIAREEVMALGDSSNDISMLRWAGIGVAMGWAPKDVREAADFVTDAADPDSVATVINRVLCQASS